MLILLYIVARFAKGNAFIIFPTSLKQNLQQQTVQNFLGLPKSPILCEFIVHNY